MWIKKGYDFVFKVCDCKCSCGYLRKDLNYVLLFKFVDNVLKFKKKSKKKNDKLVVVVSNGKLSYLISVNLNYG